MSIKKIVRAVLAAVMVVAFCGCDLWMNDWKGYLEYWSEAVLMGRVEVSGATFQTNADGVQTLPLDATANISGYVINPQGHTLLDSSIEINEPTLANSATKNVADPTHISVLLQNVASQGITEHTTFTVTFAPVRADTNIASTETMSVTLQYNTPPAAPLRMNSDGNGGFEVVQAGGTWNADNDGNLYWKWPYTTTSDTEPNAVKWFSIDGTRHEAGSCEEPNNSGIYYFQTGNKSVRIAAVDSEGIVGPSITSGVTVPAGEVIVYQITFNDDGGSGSNNPIPVVYGQELPAVTPPSRTGYTFGGYFTAQNGSGTQYYDGNGAGVKPWAEFSDVTLYAYWTANSYTITFDRAGGTGGSDSISVTYGGTPSSITLPSKAGYTFGGYYTAQNGGGDKYFNADGSYAKGTWNETSGKTLYAQWSAGTYTITFDAAGGTFNSTTTQTVTYPSKISAPSTKPVKHGKRFVGWYKNGAPYDFTSAPTENFTLTAQYGSAEIGMVAYGDGSVGYAVEYDGSATPVGIVVDARSTIKILALKQSSLQWCSSTNEDLNYITSPEYISSSNDPSKDTSSIMYTGLANTNKIKQLSGWENKFPAIKYCVDYTDASGNKTWYLPASYELKVCFGTNDANAYSTVADAISELSGKGVDVEYFGGHYWSSNTDWVSKQGLNKKDVMYMSVDSNTQWGGNYTAPMTESKNVRPIRVF
ncbi:MAG: InlB B-repeat-containing protein [Treponema sp.]|nr:InlB B-repeat-containing protein [Treponema sp.]